MLVRFLPSERVVYSRCRLHRRLNRKLSSKANSNARPENKVYSKTLLLPQTPFELQPNAKDIEKKYKKLTCEDLYRWQWENAKGPLFVLHDGPPYANGDLHMGHALNKVTKDIINRFHLSQGRKVHYVPGWDCHGLPIEGKAINDKKLSPHETPAVVIREAAQSTALREVESQKEQFRSLGIMADWDSKENTYRTLDRNYEMRQLRIFQKMVANGLIYRQHRPVYYSPSSHSALAEAELEYNDHLSESAYVAFDLDMECRPSSEFAEVVSKGIAVKFLVWTTTPWTLTANMAIAVHEDLIYDILLNGNVAYVVSSDRVNAVSQVLNVNRIDRLASLPGKALVGLPYKPLFEKSTSFNSFQIIHAPHVTSDSGTGLVHLAPAHGAEDYNAFRLQGFLSTSNPRSTLLCHVDGRGQFSPDVAEVVGEEDAMSLVGRDVLYSGSKNILRLLKQSQRLIGTERITHKYPHDWRTKEPVIVTATSQWFANLEKIKDEALKALQDVSFFPPLSSNRLQSFVQSRSEWCISRQRVWGVPIPALHHKHSDRVVLDAKSLDYILDAMDTKNLDWWTAPIELFVPPWLLEEGQTAAETWERGQDTMDVWFDSGTSWSMLPEMGVGKNRETGRIVHADVCLEGSDQHRGWFQSQLLTALGSASSDGEKCSPYGSLITHGMVLDEKGRKMSKSLGNVVSPMAILRQGADVLRLWVATVDYWKDMSIGPTVLSQVTKSLKKLRNTARFCLGNLGSKDDLAVMERVSKTELGLAERYIMNELYILEQVSLESYANYNFQKVINNLNNFATVTISSLYFDITKDCLYAEEAHSLERRRVITVLEQVLNVFTNIIAPILPYFAEEIHATRSADGTSVFMTPWVPLSRDWKDPEASQDMADLLCLRGTVLSLLEKAREAKQLGSSLEAEVDIILSDPMVDNRFVHVLGREEIFLKTLFIVSDAVVTDEGSLGCMSPSWVYLNSVSISGIDVAVRVRPARGQKCPRCWTFTRLGDSTLCTRCKTVIGQS